MAHLTLGDIAVRYGCELHGDPDQQVSGVGTLGDAVSGQLAFLANAGYRAQLPATRATAVLLSEEYADECPVAALVCANPYLVYARVAAELAPPVLPEPGVHAAAVVSHLARVPESCSVAAGAVIEAGATLGERVRVGANVTIGRDVVVGDDTRLLPGVVLHDQVQIGRRCLIYAGAVIGSDGFGNARDAGGAWTKVPQLGSVVVGDDVEVGANTTIDRGTIGDTRIGTGVRLDNLVHVGHNVEIGEHTAIAGLTGVSGSTRIGAYCMVGGQAGFAGHLDIADHTVILGQTVVTRSLRRPGAYGGPAASADVVNKWRRNAVRYRQLDELARRLLKLEQAQGDEDAAD